MSQGGGRIDALDALRGFAILGILLINIQVFSGWGFIGPEGRSALSFSEHDGLLGNILDVLVRAKFYSLFSLLFGYSFVLLAHRMADRAARAHLRRLAGLVAIGLAHSLLLWPWDILLLYGLTGYLLLPFLYSSPRTLTIWSIAMFVVVGVASGFGPQLGLPEGRGELATRVLQENVPVLSGGSYTDVLRANLHLTGSVFVEWLQDLRPLRVFGMFLLGAAAAVLRLAETDSGRATLLRWIAAASLLAGLPLAAIETFLEAESLGERLLYITAETLAAPMLAAGYAAALILWWHRNGLLAAGVRTALAPVGRMALTNYLMQSAVCVPLFYGFGAGWFAEMSLAKQLLLAFVLFAAQMVFSALWLSVFRQGPVEWLWRWQIKGERPRLLNFPKDR